MAVPITTDVIFGLRALERGTTATYVDWATGMLEKGADSRSLRILAGLELSISVFEAKDYFLKAIAELGIREPEKSHAITGYAAYLAERLIDNLIPQETVIMRLSELCCVSGYPANLMIWYELYDALRDIEYGGEPWSYPGLTKQNAPGIIAQEAAKFLISVGGSRTDPSTSSG